jgi:L-malate glycosyltransferase
MPGQKKAVQQRLMFVWANLGSQHVDRCEAVVQHFAGKKAVAAIEFARSREFLNEVASKPQSFQRITLFGDAHRKRNSFYLFRRVVGSILQAGSTDVFFLDYEMPAIWLSALLLRLLGRRLYVMSNAKFDDEERHKLTELRKFIMLLPYRGALTSSARSRDYLRFLGIAEDRIVFRYDTVNIGRIRQLSRALPAPEGTPFDDRVFLIVAQYVPADRLKDSLFAYKLYRDQAAAPRPLHIVNYGALEDRLHQHAKEMGISGAVTFCGNLQAAPLAKKLSTSLALILYGGVDSFGTIVPEAQALGLPLLISETCGAADELVRSGVNGFVVEPNNFAGLAYFMKILSEDRTFWKQVCWATLKRSSLGDGAEFARGVELLVDA